MKSSLTFCKKQEFRCKIPLSKQLFLFAYNMHIILFNNMLVILRKTTLLSNMALKK